MTGARETSPESNESAEPVGTFPMRVVSRLTGLNADTIRAWERRHRAITPPRTMGNTRLFCREDIERLGMLRDLVALGHAIGRVARLPTAELTARLAEEQGRRREASEAIDPFQRIVDGYLEAIGCFDARQGMELIHQAAAHLPPRDFIFKVALPIVRQVGARWGHGSLGVAQEHLATHHVRNALLTYQHRHPADRGAPRMLAATPSGQRHEFGLLIGALLAQLRGYDVVYLGVDLPSEELLWAAQKSQAEVLLLAASLPISGSGVEQLSELAHRLPERCKVWLGLTSDDPFEAPRVRLFRDFESFELALLESH